MYIKKKDAQGIIFGTSVSDRNKSKQDLEEEIFNYRKRQEALRALIVKPAMRVNYKNVAVQEADDEVRRAIDENQQLINKGYDPANPKHRHLFKKIDRNKMAAAIMAFGMKFIGKDV